MRKICFALATLMVIGVMCSCGSETQAEPTSSQPPSEIDLADFTDVVVWDQGIRKTFKRFTRYVLDQYIVQNSCTVSAPKLDDSYRLIMDGNETDCEISFKGDPITRELNQIVVDSPCDTDANTDALFVAGCSMLSACFDEKYSAEYGVKYFCRMVENVTEEEPMQVAQFGDTKVSVTASDAGFTFIIQHIEDNSQGNNTEQEAKEEPAKSEPTGEKKSGNDKTMDAYLNRNDESSTETSSSSSPSLGEKNALKSAKQYVKTIDLSYTGLIEQLEYEGYSKEEATYGADNCNADWMEEAAGSARQYMETMSFSRQGLLEQLLYEGFTQEQAEYGVSAVGY